VFSLKGIFMRLLLAAAALALSVGASCAAAPPPIDFSRARCEMPEITAAIRKSVGNMRLEDGSSLLSYLGNNSGLQATTISATRNKLVCRVTVNLMVRGAPLAIRGRFTVRVVPGNTVKSEFLADY
jgi:hypothetical protein